jgi:hypothetical protein
MTRVLPVALVVLVLSPAAASARIVAASRLPTDVQAGLAAQSIGVAQTTDVSPDSLAVTAHRALGIAKRNFGWIRGERPDAYLIRIIDHPDVFDPPVVGASGWTDIHPLQVGDLAWLVVIRNAKVPILCPPGGSYRSTLAVLVETTQPEYALGMTI